VRVLLICPIPLEYTTCRTAPVPARLRTRPWLSGQRAARWAMLTSMAMATGPAKARAAAGTVARYRALPARPRGGFGHLRRAGRRPDRECNRAGDFPASNTTSQEAGCRIEFIPEMRLPSAFEHPLPPGVPEARARFHRAGQGPGHPRAQRHPGLRRVFLSSRRRCGSPLQSVSGAAACNWESAGVFVGALRSRIPPVSIRAVSDLGDEDAMRDFRRNVRPMRAGLVPFHPRRAGGRVVRRAQPQVAGCASGTDRQAAPEGAALARRSRAWRRAHSSLISGPGRGSIRPARERGELQCRRPTWETRPSCLKESTEMVREGYYASRTEGINDAIRLLLKQYKLSKLHEKDSGLMDKSAVGGENSGG